MRSSKSKSTQPEMQAFRDTDNKTVAYGANPNAAVPEDTDNEALIAPQGVDEESMQHFTATGRPAPKYKASANEYAGDNMYTQPHLLPKRYTDDSIIPAIITDVIPAARSPAEEEKAKKGGFFAKLKGKKEEFDENGERKGITKVVYMPRRDYIASFAKDEKGVYIGKEPYRRWTEDELEEKYAHNKPEYEQMKNGRK